MHAWTTVGNRQHCELHATSFERGDGCSLCSTISLAELESPTVIAHGFASTLDHEQKFCELSDEVMKLARSAVRKKDMMAAAKFFDLAIKARSRALSLAITREHQQYITGLQLQVKEMRKAH